MQNHVLPQVRLVVLGQVDAGKSTTVGHLALHCGAVDQHTIDRLGAEAAALGRSSRKYAWVLDRLKAERERGTTIDAAELTLTTAGRRLTIVDVPGHRDFLRNMLFGTSGADAALLVVPADQAEFSAGMAQSATSQGLTCEHLRLAYALGLRQLVVACNKMDAVGWSERRFGVVRAELAALLKKVGFRPEKVAFVPISGLHGHNLVNNQAAADEPPPVTMPWYAGPTLIEALGAIEPPGRRLLLDRPLRVPLQDVYKIGGIGTVPVGRVESGVLRQGTPIVFAPGNITGLVHSIEQFHNSMTEAGPGENVGFSVKQVSVRDIRRGHVAGDVWRDPPLEVVDFTALIVITNHTGRIAVGYTPVVDCHTAHIACTFKELVARLDRRTGRTLEARPKWLKAGDVALVVLAPVKPLCVETFVDHPALGRFAVRDTQHNVGIGVIKSVTRKRPVRHCGEEVLLV
jgi:elongation factor 1-alpha